MQGGCDGDAKTADTAQALERDLKSFVQQLSNAVDV
jgi:hypothetical protein